jgi:hypothetical protein
LWHKRCPFSVGPDSPILLDEISGRSNIAELEVKAIEDGAVRNVMY